MKVLICGAREWNDFTTVKTYLETLVEKYSSSEEITIIHGGCQGADSIAGHLAKQLGMQVQVFKAEWDKWGKAAGPKRNQQMIDDGKPDLVVAFHNDIEKSKGTKDMITRAKKHNLEVQVLQSS